MTAKKQCYDEDFNAHNDRVLLVQDGWTEDGRRKMVEHSTDWLCDQCHYYLRKTDPACTGCKWSQVE